MDLTSLLLIATCVIVGLLVLLGLYRNGITCKYRIRMIDEDIERYKADPRSYDDMMNDLTIWTYRQFYPEQKK